MVMRTSQLCRKNAKYLHYNKQFPLGDRVLSHLHLLIGFVEYLCKQQIANWPKLDLEQNGVNTATEVLECGVTNLQS